MSSGYFGIARQFGKQFVESQTWPSQMPVSGRLANASPAGVSWSAVSRSSACRQRSVWKLGCSKVFSKRWVPMRPSSCHALNLTRASHRSLRLPRAGIALGILREAVFFNFVEPNVFGARVLASETLLFIAPRLFAKNQNGRLDAGVGLEHAARQGDNAFHNMLGEQFAAQALVGIGVAEQYALRNDDCTASADLQQVEHQPQEQQFAFVGDGVVFLFAFVGGAREQLAVFFQVVSVHRAGKRRIGQHKVVGFRFKQFG